MQQDRSGMTMTAILPGTILGPVMTQAISGSVEVVYRLLKNTVSALPRIDVAISDVEDLIDLDLRAMESDEAADQRFVGVGDFL